MKKRTLVFFLCALLPLLAGCKLQPKLAIRSAYNMTFTPEHPLEENLGISTMFKEVKKGHPYLLNANLTLQRARIPGITDIDLSLAEGAGLSLNGAVSPLSSEAGAEFGITYGNATLLNGELALNQNTLYARVPKLADASFSTDLSTLGADINGSSLVAGVLQNYVALPSDFSVRPWKYIYPWNPTPAAGTVSFSEAKKYLFSQVTFEKLSKKEVTLPADVKAKSFYMLRAPKEAFGTFLSQLCNNVYDNYSFLLPNGFPEKDFLSAFCKNVPDMINDPQLLVCISKKGYIVYAELKADIKGVPYKLTLNCRGSENPGQLLDFVLHMENGDSVRLFLENTGDDTLFSKDIRLIYSLDGEIKNGEATLCFDRETKEFEFSATLSKESNVFFSFAGSGYFTDIQKDKAFHVFFDYLDAEYKGFFDVSISGDVALNQNGAVINYPSGKEYKVFKIGAFDAIVLVPKIKKNIDKDPLLSKIYEYITEY